MHATHTRARQHTATLATIVLTICSALAVLIGPGAAPAAAAKPMCDGFTLQETKIIKDLPYAPSKWLFTLRLYYANSSSQYDCTPRNAADLTLEGEANHAATLPYKTSISICTTVDRNNKWCRNSGMFEQTIEKRWDQLTVDDDGMRRVGVVYTGPSSGYCVLVQAYIMWPPYSPYPYSWSTSNDKNTLVWGEIFGYCG